MFTGDESIVNRPNAAARLHHAHARHAQKLVIGKGHPVVPEHHEHGAEDLQSGGEDVRARHPAHDIV